MVALRFLEVKTPIVFLLIVAFLGFFIEPLSAQKESFKKITTSFEEYNSAFREVAYSHLNKSTYIKGEMLGFASYIFEKEFKVPSKETKNLYCVITDGDDKVIKSKLVKVTNGFANNVFKIDSLFTSGNYTFKSYTNWMKNFNEQNAYVESFRVIDPNVEDVVKKEVSEHVLDAQFLPEGGYFVDLVKTNVGVVIKNDLGLGVPDLEGNVYDSNNEYITTFKTNSLGIGKFLMYPKMGQKYTVKINYLNKLFKFTIDDVKPKGISIHVNNSKQKVVIELKTNQRTLEDIKGKDFKLIVHNGKRTKGINVAFKREDFTTIIDHQSLFSGINIFTLFDENDIPILERMFFNYNGINIAKSGDLTHIAIQDSTRISIPFTKIPESVNDNFNVSVSILAKETKSYNRHHNIISYTHLQPYVKGYIENAKYYFTDISLKTKYDLDKLLITQGWSSYNWDNIFNNNVTDNYAFENGIVLKANQRSKRETDFIIYPLKNSSGFVVKLEEENNSFVSQGLFPEANEKLSIGVFNKKGKVSMPNLSMQFFPSRIPKYLKKHNTLNPNASFTTNIEKSDSFTLDIPGKVQQLDEVYLETSLEQEKIRKLRMDAFSTFDIFDDAKRSRNLTFVTYVNQYMPQYNAFEQQGQVFIGNRVQTTLNGGNQSPIVYLDDLLLVDLTMLYGFDMSVIDYVTVNRYGHGEGFIGANGVIRLYSKTDAYKDRIVDVFEKFDVPLTFAKNKKFYAPKYKTYNDDFFKQYGVIDWIPCGKLDDYGNLNFTIYNPANNNLKLFIEGVTDKGEYISETKVLNMNTVN